MQLAKYRSVLADTRVARDAVSEERKRLAGDIAEYDDRIRRLAEQMIHNAPLSTCKRNCRKGPPRSPESFATCVALCTKPSNDTLRKLEAELKEVEAARDEAKADVTSYERADVALTQLRASAEEDLHGCAKVIYDSFVVLGMPPFANLLAAREPSGDSYRESVSVSRDGEGSGFVCQSYLAKMGLEAGVDGCNMTDSAGREFSREPDGNCKVRVPVEKLQRAYRRLYCKSESAPAQRDVMLTIIPLKRSDRSDEQCYLWTWTVEGFEARKGHRRALGKQFVAKLQAESEVAVRDAVLQRVAGLFVLTWRGTLTPVDIPEWPESVCLPW